MQTDSSDRAYECPDCRDRGWREKEGNVWAMCQCQETKRRKTHVARLWAEANFPEGIEDQTLHGMDLRNKDTKAMVEVAKDYITEQEPPFLAFFGSNGNGKTRVALAIAKALLLNEEMPVYFAYLPVFLERLQRGQFTGRDYQGQDHGDLMDRAYTKGLLVLDDLGLYKVTEWADVQLDKIVGYRYMQGLRTIITTNVKRAKLPVRMNSRLGDGAKCRVIVVEAPDYRVNNAPRYRGKKG